MRLKTLIKAIDYRIFVALDLYLLYLYIYYITFNNIQYYFYI